MKIPGLYENVELDEFVVMPNHLHGIIALNNTSIRKGVRKNNPNRTNVRENTHDRKGVRKNTPNRTNVRENTHDRKGVRKNTPKKEEYYSKISPFPHSLSVIVRAFKASLTKWCKNKDLFFGWHRSFHDRIIRSEKELYAIREYIINNTVNWIDDRENLNI